MIKPYSGNDPFIFISYSHKDMAEVLSVVEMLQSDGYNVWYDEGIDPGTEWDDNIALHVENCNCFFAFISENYIASDNCKDELNYARDLNKNRLLVYITDVKLTGGLAMRLNRLQSIYKHKYTDINQFKAKLYDTYGIEVCRSAEKKQVVSAGNAVIEEKTEPEKKVVAEPIKKLSNVQKTAESAPALVYVENMTGKDGDFEYTYTGYTLNGKRHGDGKIIWANGDVYDGEWLNDTCHGLGICSFSDGDVYEGEWKNGHFDGIGKYTCVDGSVYDGEWLDDQRHGIGKYTSANGDVCDGEWENDEFVMPIILD